MDSSDLEFSIEKKKRDLYCEKYGINEKNGLVGMNRDVFNKLIGFVFLSTTIINLVRIDRRIVNWKNHFLFKISRRKNLLDWIPNCGYGLACACQVDYNHMVFRSNISIFLQRALSRQKISQIRFSWTNVVYPIHIGLVENVKQIYSLRNMIMGNLYFSYSATDKFCCGYLTAQPHLTSVSACGDYVTTDTEKEKGYILRPYQTISMEFNPREGILMFYIDYRLFPSFVARIPSNKQWLFFIHANDKNILNVISFSSNIHPVNTIKEAVNNCGADGINYKRPSDRCFFIYFITFI
jgi:hypothetical protein